MPRRSSTRLLGRVVFVGAGPGDPGLLAVHAVEVLRTADVLVADAAVPDAVLAHAGVAARAPEIAPAETAKAMLIDARAGSTVVRVVAGDVFADDAAIKESLAVARTVVPFEIVPGISAGTGAVAYAGVPYGPMHTEALLSVDTTD